MIAHGGRPRQLDHTPIGGAVECCQIGRDLHRQERRTLASRKQTTTTKTEDKNEHTTHQNNQKPATTTTTMATPTPNHGVPQDTPERFGDDVTTKHDNSIRIMFQNINGLPAKKDKQKNTHILETVNGFETDIFAASEVNKYWPNIPADHRPQHRFRGWWENSHIGFAYNSTFRQKQASQPGGNMIITTGHAATRVKGGKTNNDPSGLGRWCSTPIRGKNGMSLRIVSAYRPSNKIAKRNTTYSQHIRYFNQISRDGCPQQLFWDDLFAQLDEWRKTDELIILAVDANQDIRSRTLTAAMRQRGMEEVMIARHGDDLPPTCSGSKPIDGIFASSEIRVSRCGYLDSEKAFLATTEPCGPTLIRPSYTTVSLSWRCMCLHDDSRLPTQKPQRNISKSGASLLQSTN